MASSLRLIIPSALTIGALVSGLSAVKCAAENDFVTAVSCILLACVLDGLDGHTARYLDACTKIGFELDSLCDCANFGVVPALVVYFWAKAFPTSECSIDSNCSRDNMLLWAGCCTYTSCCALRLARFNVDGRAAEMDKSYLKSPGGRKPPVPKTLLHNFLTKNLYFKGVPAPVGAAYSLTPLMFQMSRSSDVASFPGGGRLVAGLTMVFTGILMVSSLPTYSSKMFKMDSTDTYLRSRNPFSGLAKAAAAGGFLYCLWFYPLLVILSMNFGHVASIPLSITTYLKCSGDSDDARDD